LKREIPLFNIYWDKEESRLTSEAIKRGQYWAEGPNIETFERMLAGYTGKKYCLVFNSGTSALHSILLAYNIGPDDEVIVPSFTFIATANAPLFVGAKPVFADIEEETFGLDPKDVERKITSKTRAILPIHYGGSPCKVRELREIADTYGLILIEDAAEALGARIDERKVGTFGHSAIFSFCQNKIITTGEGGAIVTSSKKVYEQLKLIRSHGRLETADYFTSSEHMDYVTIGYNFRLSDLSAALGIAQLKKIDKIIAMRRSNAEYMTKSLLDVKQIRPPKVPDGHFHVYQMYVIRIKGRKNTRNKLIAYLKNYGITTKVNFYPIHLTRFYQEKFGYQEGELPITEQISHQVITLPMYPTLLKEEIDYIVEQIRNFFSEGTGHE